MEDAEYDSDDYERTPAIRAHPLAGKASITAMMENRLEDRTRSKKRATELVDVRGAVGSRSSRELWWNRFQAWWQEQKSFR